MIRATILGCGSSGGVPRLGNRWGACDPANPRNRRRRCSLLVERDGAGGTTQVLIDTGPDMVPQLLDAGVATLDAVIYSHHHADHVHGIDDIRQLVHNSRRKMPVWADEPTSQALLDRFGYIFSTPAGSYYLPIAELNRLTGPVAIDGPGGAISFQPFRVQHGEITALGFRIGGLVYLPDVSQIPDTAWPLIEGRDLRLRRAAPRSPSQPRASGAGACVAGAGRHAARGADEHAYRHGLRSGHGAHAGPYRSRP